MHTRLLFFQVINHLLAVLSEIGEYKRHMYPVGAVSRVLPYQLVEGQMILDVVEYLSAKRHVALDVDVCGLTLQVLGVIDSAHGLVQFLTAVAAADFDRFAHRHAERFEHIGAEINEVDHLLRGGFVIYSETLGHV